MGHSRDDMDENPLRREFLKTVGVAGGIGMTIQPNVVRAGTTQESSQIGDWPMYGYNAANTGHAPDETGPTENIGELWSFQAEDEVTSGFSVVENTVYVGTRAANVLALDASDGNELWRFETENAVYSTPAIRDGVVYVGSNEGNLYAIDASDGTELWRFETEFRIQPSPTVVDGTVYVGTGSFGQESYGFALDASDGTEQWRFESGGDLTAPAVVDGTVFFGGRDNYVYALDATDGTELWSFETGFHVFSSPAVANNTVYVGSSDDNVYALDAADGTEQWRFQAQNWVDTSPAVVENTVYVADGYDSNGNVYALDAADGSEQWRFQANDEVDSSIAVVDGALYFGSEAGNIYGLDMDDGAVLWRFESGSSIQSSPAVVDGTVYIGDNGGNIYALSSMSTPTPTPTQTPTETQPVTATPTPGGVSTTQVQETVAEQSPNTPASSPNRSIFSQLTDPGMILGIGGTGLLLAGIYRLARSGSSEDDDDGGEGTHSVEELLNQAETALEDANTAKDEENLSEARNHFEKAISNYKTAVNKLPSDDDRRDDVESSLQAAQTERDDLQNGYTGQIELTDTLQSAESHFQTAIAAPASDQVVIPRERYRQARDEYGRALEHYDDLDEPPGELQVVPEVDIEAPPERLSEFPGITPAALDLLDELDLDTLSALREADEDTIQRIRDADEINERLTIRLVGLHNWADGEQVMFRGREELEERLRLATEGYETHN